ncbi:MAG: menaquinone biosynthetic enzyme MqnA/MqnD family protein [Gemmatimonadota bacterium]
MLRLGHIDYANCFPVHALLLDRGAPPSVRIRRGVPTALNGALAAGEIDVAPASSIEYARNAGRYRIVPDFAIAARGPVRSVILETATSIEELGAAPVVALPTASATSVVVARALLERRWGLRPRYRRFDQDDSADPLERGADAALWIGDRALRRAARTRRCVTDVGAAWTAWTDLPFVFALWQVSAGPDRDRELAALHALLLESFAYFRANDEALAHRYAADVDCSPGELLDYWRSLDYRYDAALGDGLLRFYALAVELGEAPGVPRLRWAPTAG